LGKPIKVSDAEDHIFGVVIMNDWSARDIQAYEYVPLGPFLGKNFGTTISPWVVTLDALECARVPAPMQDPIPAEYLVDKKASNDAYDIQLDVILKPKGSDECSISRSNLKYLYWTFKQQLAHHTVNGCNMRTGDLLATGTISGPTKESLGSLLEMSWNGSEPLNVQGKSRTFLEDGDELILKGYWSNGSKRIGFGISSGVVLPAI
jgi:fumarylacetoacetase